MQKKYKNKTLSFFFRYILHEKSSLYLIVVLHIIFNVLGNTANVIMPKLLIDELMMSRRMHIVILLVGATITFNCIMPIFNKLFVECKNAICDKVTRKLEAELNYKMMELSYKQVDDRDIQTGCYKAKEAIGKATGGLQSFFEHFVSLVSWFDTAIIVSSIVLINAPMIFLLQICCLASSFYINKKMNEEEISFFNNTIEDQRRFYHIGFDMADLDYAKDIRLYDAEPLLVKKAKQIHRKIIERKKDQEDNLKRLEMFIQLINSFRMGITFVDFGIRLLKGNWSIGTFTMMFQGCNSMSDSLMHMLEDIQNISKETVMFSAYVAFVDINNEDGEDENEETIQCVDGIEFKDVYFKYPNSDNMILKNLNLKINKGERIALVGQNGSGKTTMIKLLCRLYRPTSGDILINGKSIYAYSAGSYVKILSVVFQDFSTMCFPLFENILCKEDMSSEEKEKIENILSLCGLGESGNIQMTTSLGKEFEENGIEASGGEKQKIAIARAMYKDSEVLIMDEPTAALDTVAEVDLYTKFIALINQKTALIVSHRLTLCHLCDRIILLKNGTIKEQGTHEELMKLCGDYFQMYSVQANSYAIKG